jgi:hypothetical protein
VISVLKMDASNMQHKSFPRALAFFTPLNNAFRGLPEYIGLSQHGEVQYPLLDMAGIICNLVSHPTHMSELVQAGYPDYIGYCDAGGFGAGGMWFGGWKKLDPIIWRAQWPKDITQML